MMKESVFFREEGRKMLPMTFWCDLIEVVFFEGVVLVDGVLYEEFRRVNY